MAKAVGRIIKRNDVELEGQVQLGLAYGRAFKDRLRAASKPKPGASEDTTTSGSVACDAGKSSVQIVENQPGFAVIEITCCCGEKTYLRCEYVSQENPKIKN